METLDLKGTRRARMNIVFLNLTDNFDCGILWNKMEKQHTLLLVYS